MNLHDMTSGDKKSSFASQEFLHFHQTLLQKGKVGFRKRKKQTIKDIRFKCYQMWAKHWREVLKYLRLCLHVFSGSVSYDVTASAQDSLLQWLLEPNASFFSYPHSNTCTRLQKYVSIYVHMHMERQIQSDSALHSTCLISFNASELFLCLI